MNNSYKTIIELMLLLCIIVLSFLLGRISKNCNKIVNSIIKRDTTVIIKQADPIILEKVKPKIIIQKDTVILTKPFIATIDTIIKWDTIFAKYTFPENNFDLFIRKKQDSILIQTVYITKEIVKDRAWWETSVYTLSGTLVGFLIGRAIK